MSVSGALATDSARELRIACRKWMDRASSLSLTEMGFKGQETMLIESLAIQGFRGGSELGQSRFRTKSCEFFEILDRVRRIDKLDEKGAEGLLYIIGLLKLMQSPGESVRPSVPYCGANRQILFPHYRVPQENWQTLNPRNIFFKDPDFDEDYGTLNIRGHPVYGHFMTKKYVEYIETLDNAIKKGLYYSPSKNFQFLSEYKNGGLQAVPPTYYSSLLNESRPPLWQALFGDGSEKPFNAPELLPSLEGAINDSDKLKAMGDKEKWGSTDWVRVNLCQSRINSIERYLSWKMPERGGESLRTWTSAGLYPLFLPFSNLIRSFRDLFLDFKKRPRCSYCREKGHQIQSCPYSYQFEYQREELH